MATPKQAEAAKTFLEGIVAKLPADKQQAFRDQFMVEDAVLSAVGDGVMARSDYSAQTQQLKRDRDALDAYYAENSPKVERANKLLERFPDGVIPDDFGTEPPPPPAAKPVDVAAIEQVVLGKVGKRVEDSERGAAAFMAKLTDMSNKHFATFGEHLNTSEMVNDPRVYEVGLDGLYQEKFRDKYQAKADAELNAKIEAAKKEGRDAAVAELRAAGGQQPYPTPNAARNPVMAALAAEQTERLADPSKFENRPFVNRVDAGAAAEEYHKLAGVTTP
jgi:hypothetical protein